MKKQPSATSLNVTEEASFPAFKKREKQYKYFVDKKTDFSEMIDLNQSPLNPAWKIEEFSVVHPITGTSVKGYRFPKPSGLIILKNYTEIERQLFICRKSLNEYHRKPHRTNLFIYQKEEEDAKPAKVDTESCMAPQKAEEATEVKPTPCQEKKIDSNSMQPNQDTSAPREYNKEHYIVADPDRYYFNSKIRWSNLGRQYNWDKRDYHTKESPMPVELAEIAKEIITLLGMGDYKPEALIANYYGWRNFMGGHLDDGEPDQKHPIVSFSFGLSCVFLIGGKTKEVDPAAIKLDSGDVMIMSQESRNCFHGR